MKFAIPTEAERTLIDMTLAPQIPAIQSLRRPALLLIVAVVASVFAVIIDTDLDAYGITSDTQAYMDATRLHWQWILGGFGNEASMRAHF